MTQGRGKEQPMIETGSVTGSVAAYSKSPWQPRPFAPSSSSSSHAGIEVLARVRSTPSPLPSSSPPPPRSRFDTDAASSGEPSKESLLVLRDLMESSCTRKVHDEQRQPNERSEKTSVEESPASPPSPSLPPNKATVFVGSTVTTAKKQQHKRPLRGIIRPRRAANVETKQPKELRATITATAGGKDKPWFLRVFRGKSGGTSTNDSTGQGIPNVPSKSDSRSSRNRRGVDAKPPIAPPRLLQAPSSLPDKGSMSPPLETKNSGVSATSTARRSRDASSTASSSSAALRQKPPSSIRRSRSGTRSSTPSSHVSTRGGSSHEHIGGDDDERKVDRHESIVESLVRRLEEMEQMETATTGAAESSAATSSGDGDGLHHQHCSTSSQGMSRQASEAAANSQAATQPIDNRQKVHQHKKNMIPPSAVVKTGMSPSAVSSLAHEQSTSGDGPLRLLSTVEENLDEVLSIPSSWSKPPPVEVTVNPNHYQQNLSLSLSASDSEAEDESINDDDYAQTADKATTHEEPQSQSFHDQISSKLSSSSMPDKGQEVLADPSWYEGPGAVTSIADAVASNDIIKDSFARELQRKQGQLRHIHIDTSPVNDDDEPTAAAAASTPEAQTKKATTASSDQETTVKSFKASLESNYIRIIDAKRRRDGSLAKVPETSPDCSVQCDIEKQASPVVVPPRVPLPTPTLTESLVKPSPSILQNISQSHEASTLLAVSDVSGASMPSNRAPVTKTLQDQLQEQLQQLKHPQPDDDAERSIQPPLPHQRSRIESKLIAENDDGIEAVAVEDDALHVVQASDDDADQTYQSPVSAAMSPISTMSCSDDEGGASTWTEEEEEEGECDDDDDHDDDEGYRAAAKEKSRRAKKMLQRKNQYDKIQRTRRQAAMKTRERGWEGWGLDDEPKLASNVISWDSDSYNRPARVSKRKKAKASKMKKAPRLEPPVPPKHNGWFTFNSLMTTGSLVAAESEPETRPSRPRGQMKKRRGSKRRGHGEPMDDDFFSDTDDSDNRPEQDLPLLIKRLTNQHFQQTLSMISREFKLSMSYPDDREYVARVDSGRSSQDDATGGDEEGDSTFASQTDSDREAESCSRDSFFTEEKKEMESFDMASSSSKRMPAEKRNDSIVKQKSGWSAAGALIMNDYVCAPSREDILSMSCDSDT